jgi:hypothetical protein
MRIPGRCGKTGYFRLKHPQISLIHLKPCGNSMFRNQPGYQKMYEPVTGGISLYSPGKRGYWKAHPGSEQNLGELTFSGTAFRADPVGRQRKEIFAGRDAPGGISHKRVVNKPAHGTFVAGNFRNDICYTDLLCCRSPGGFRG